jgi:hypothetical protein
MLTKSFLRMIVILSIMAIISNTMGACGGKPTMTSIQVGNAIEGIYTVHHQGMLIGHLNLHNGKYSFTLLDDKVTQETIAQIFFGRYPDGNFNIEFYGSVNQSTRLEDLENDDILLRIRFSTDKTNKDFFIRNNKDKKEVYLHSIISEVELWSISKSWEQSL